MDKATKACLLEFLGWMREHEERLLFLELREEAICAAAQKADPGRGFQIDEEARKLSDLPDHQLLQYERLRRIDALKLLIETLE